MNMFIIDNEVFIRLGFFFGIFGFMAAWEIIAPRRSLTNPKRTRWFNNLMITFLNSVLVRLVFPVTAIGVALFSAQRGWGIFNIMDMPQWITGTIAIIVLDLTIYAQHVFFHKIPLFWRLHRMHHTDLDIDVTTGARFHPIEIILSMGIKMAVVVILGAPAWAVLSFEVLLNATSMFNHSNVFMNQRLDRLLRIFLVTPDMHRVHHSVIIKETDSNFGFNLPWWDRLFGTYRDQPVAGHEAMTIGLANYREHKWLALPWMLFVPFSDKYR
jgi:sterol desaturase/sphingolipid hydroxylase (fatty acid hydroxylase superfamily)